MGCVVDPRARRGVDQSVTESLEPDQEHPGIMSTTVTLAPPLRVERLTKRFRQGTATIEALKDVSLSTPDEVGARIMARASGMIWASCYLPLITLLVTSLGVVNTVMASVRARRWEFRILRSQGVTRSGLFRMILAEGLLIGLITCLLSLGFGVFSGWCGTAISQYVSFFGGLAPPLVIPWPQLSLGISAALTLCLAAALWPAIATGRAEPLRLLQEGRAAL